MKDAGESICAQHRVMLTFWRVLTLSAPRILKFMTNSKAIAAVGMFILLRMGPQEKKIQKYGHRTDKTVFMGV